MKKSGSNQALTVKDVDNAKPQPRQYKLWDERGLYLLIMPNGGKYWRFKYYFATKEKNLALGVYPEVTLAQARAARDAAREVVRDMKDPAEIRKKEKLLLILGNDNTYENIARQWAENYKAVWTEKYYKTTLKRLENNIFPVLGTRPIDRITPQDLLACLKKVEKRGAVDMAHRILQLSSQIYKYALASQVVSQDITIGLSRSMKPHRKKHNPHLEAEEIKPFFVTLEQVGSNEQVKIATKLLFLTFVRTKELIMAEWKEINFDKPEWVIPADRMKMRVKHVVPLSEQVIALLRQMQKISGDSKHIFPNRNKPREPMSNNAILSLIHRMGYKGKVTGHGFRGTASTILNEKGFHTYAIERQLSHSERDEVKASYDHSKHLPERIKMMKWWGAYMALFFTVQLSL